MEWPFSASVHRYYTYLAPVPGLPRSVRVLIMRRRQTSKRARNGGGLEPRLIPICGGNTPTDMEIKCRARRRYA